jgi:hypothetical protein
MAILARVNRGIRLRDADWHKLLELAHNYGWTPIRRAASNTTTRDVKAASTSEAQGLDNEEEASASETLTMETEAAVEGWWSLRPALAAYHTSRHAYVTSKDAKAMATALTSALPDIPNHWAMEDKTTEIPGDFHTRRINPGVSFTLFEYFSGAKKTALIKCIEFFKKGAFQVLNDECDDAEAA